MIQKETTFKDAQLEQAMKKIFTRAQPTEHRYFTSAPTTADLQNGEFAFALISSKYYLYGNISNSIQRASLELTQSAAQADSTASDVAGIVADFNSLLAKLRTAKLIAT